LYRLLKSAMATLPQLMIAAAAAFGSALGPFGVVAMLALAGAVGVLLFHSRKLGVIAFSVVAVLILITQIAPWSMMELVSLSAESDAFGHAPTLSRIGSLFFVVGAFSFGGGLAMIAFIQEQVVNQYSWLIAREFVDGLALGQLTPGPVLMVSGYVGYKLAGAWGAAVGAASIFLPSFVLMLSVLPAFERARKLLWTRAAMKGIGPAVIGVLAVSLFQLAPHALPDPIAIAVFIGTVSALLAWRISAIKLMVAGALVGVLKSRLLALLHARGTL